jgi:AcrR family transcriptional regulator
MNTTHKRSRSKADLQAKVLEEATKLAGEEGWGAVSMRKIAERIGYSVPVIYDHFKNKDALLFEVLREGFRLLAEQLRGADVQGQSPRERLTELATVFWEFAFSHEVYYEIMHSLGAVEFGTQDTPEEAREVFALIAGAVEACGDEGSPAPDRVDLLWGMLHGMISLTRNNRIKGGRERAYGLLMQYIERQ